MPPGLRLSPWSYNQWSWALGLTVVELRLTAEVPPTKQQVDDLFQWFDDDEVVPIPPAVPITPVNVLAAPAPENAIGSPSTTVISEG
ncbi:hypothetical protein Tco_1140988, partial [Tanacetum coccineum]